MEQVFLNLTLIIKKNKLLLKIKCNLQLNKNCFLNKISSSNNNNILIFWLIQITDEELNKEKNSLFIHKK